MRVVNILMPVVAVLIFSCTGGDSRMRSEIATLKSTPITLPSYIATIHDRTTPTYPLKLVVFHSKNSCSSCEVQLLHQWDEKITRLNRQNVACYFIFAPIKQDIRVVQNALKGKLFSHPAFIDSVGEFELVNPHMPKNPALHTFLLDENNNVILVGNPLQNLQIEKMFKEEVQKRLGNAAN